jgi:N-acetylmuramoyl-L-alanine amidase
MTVRPAIFPLLALASLAALLCAPRAAGAAAAAKSLGVVYADGRDTEDVPLASLEKDSDELFISAYDLARIFKATKFWNAGNRKLVLRVGNHRYMFTIDTRVVVVDETPVLLRLNVRYERDAIMIPLEFITGVLAQRMAEKISLDPGRLLLSIGSPEYNVAAIEILDDKDGTRAILTLTEELLYHIDSETPGILRLKIYGGRLDPLGFTLSEGKGLLNRVRAEQMERDAYLFFDVKKTVRRYRVEFETSVPPEGAAAEGGAPRKLVLFLERGKLPEIPEVDFAGKKMVEMLDEGAKRKIIEPVRTIALDPGHGGPDIGKIGPSGAREKDLNLQIALMLRDRLAEELGIAVVMTRTEDVLVPFDRRVETANAAGAQLFISIHGWFTSDAEGFEVIFLAPARTEDEARLARDENASAAYENPAAGGDPGNDIDFILWDVVQNEYLNESSDLAEMIQREMSKTLGIRNRGVKQTSLRVLRGLAMPGVLVETAFLSNPKEEKLLLGAEFREKIVEGAIEAVRKFQSRYGETRAKPAIE